MIYTKLLTQNIFKILPILALFLTTATALGQVLDTRVTYLWDVTLSMKGLGDQESPDIWEQVKNALINDISSINDDRTEIIIVPFQNDILVDNIYRAKADKNGKALLISNIKKFDTNKRTKTNISRPLTYSIDSIFSKDKLDIMKLMTDGNDNVDHNKYEQTLDNWCTLAEEKNVYGYFIMLTDEAAKHRAMISERARCRLQVVQTTKVDDIVTLKPQAKTSINIKELIKRYSTNVNEATVSIDFSNIDGSKPAEKGFTVNIIANDQYVQLNTEAQVINNRLEFTINFLKSLGEISTQLGADNYKLLLSFRPANGMEKSPYTLTKILDVKTELELINKPEKELKFHVE